MYVLRAKRRINLKGRMTTVYAGFKKWRSLYRHSVNVQDAFLYEKSELKNMDPSWHPVEAEYDSEGIIRRVSKR